MDTLTQRRCEQIMEVPVPQVAGQFVARSVAVPVLYCFSKKKGENVAWRRMGKFTERNCEQIVEVPVPQVAVWWLLWNVGDCVSRSMLGCAVFS